MADIALKVVVDEAHIGKTDVVSRSAVKVGMRVESIVPEIGVIYGSGDETLLASLAKVEGVQKVDKETSFCLPPCSEKVPQ
ncbi:hypothetical protein [Afifella sp. YEN Y35]|uniref:hypothetical protein n=1 Tax=Afifella sp. YEN Y35 TaxID=3388337 RepID=UPI0039DF4F73